MKVEDIKEYSFANAFLKAFEGLTYTDYENFVNEIFEDVTLYSSAIYTKESHKIFNLLNLYRFSFIKTATKFYKFDGFSLHFMISF